MNCDHCAHAGICKYEDDARRFEETLTRYITSEDKEYAVSENGSSRQIYTKPSCITLLFKCEKFKQRFTNDVKNKKLTNNSNATTK